MKHKCPKCSRLLYDRRLTCCGYCGAVIPEEMRFSPEEIAEAEQEIAEMEAARRQKQALEDAVRKAVKEVRPQVRPVYFFFNT